jgi:hypothetical protein
MRVSLWRRSHPGAASALLACALLVHAAARAAPRVAPVPDSERSDDEVADDTWTALEARLTPDQLLDTLITVGGYRSASFAINSAGVQLDANMAEFRSAPELR